MVMGSSVIYTNRAHLRIRRSVCDDIHKQVYITPFAIKQIITDNNGPNSNLFSNLFKKL